MVSMVSLVKKRLVPGLFPQAANKLSAPAIATALSCECRKLECESSQVAQRSRLCLFGRLGRSPAYEYDLLTFSISVLQIQLHQRMMALGSATTGTVSLLQLFVESVNGGDARVARVRAPSLSLCLCLERIHAPGIPP